MKKVPGIRDEQIDTSRLWEVNERQRQRIIEKGKKALAEAAAKAEEKALAQAIAKAEEKALAEERAFAEAAAKAEEKALAEARAEAEEEEAFAEAATKAEENATVLSSEASKIALSGERQRRAVAFKSVTVVLMLLTIVALMIRFLGR